MRRTGSLIFRALRCGGSCSFPDRGSGVRPCADAGGGLRRGGRRCKEARRSKDARRIGGRRTPPTWGHSSLPYLKFPFWWGGGRRKKITKQNKGARGARGA